MEMVKGMRRKIIPYNLVLKEYARQLRNNSTRSEIKLWQFLRNKQLRGYDFHRQKPVDNYILDFFCYELMLGIELDGATHIYNDQTGVRDLQKIERMKELGISVLHFWDDEVMNDLPNVIYAIEGFIDLYEAK